MSGYFARLDRLLIQTCIDLRLDIDMQSYMHYNNYET